LAAPIDANLAQTVCTSITLTPEGILNQGIHGGFFGLYLDSVVLDGRDVFFGKSGAGTLNKYIVERRGGNGQQATGVDVVVGQTELLVLKADFGPGVEHFRPQQIQSPRRSALRRVDFRHVSPRSGVCPDPAPVKATEAR
jgi:hypothetical protein